MQLSETVEWGLHACLALAMMPQGARIPSRALAEYHGVKPSYFSKAMQKLVAAGVVEAIEGRSGGLAMAKPAEEVSLLQIVMALEENSTFFRCTEIRQKGPCSAAPKHYRAPCNIARIMYKADAAWRRVLAETSLADLRESATAEPIPGVNEATLAWLTETGAVRGL
ncbi:Rrf2 family transcriptional regulator [Yoonia sp. GPGPB17]|uniref:RrF2 family transcriptional regulator n=1 Tax=Yoonia sp. GPGPB17 TaxID=3026147 RepID=UPI0030C5103A